MGAAKTIVIIIVVLAIIGVAVYYGLGTLSNISVGTGVNITQQSGLGQYLNVAAPPPEGGLISNSSVPASP